MAKWRKILTSGSAIDVTTIHNESAVDATFLTGSFTGSFTGDGSGLTGTGFNIDELSNTLTTLAEGDLLVAADVDASNEEKKITFANLRDDMFSDISGDASVAAGGALTIASNAVENSMIAVGTIASASISGNTIDEKHLKTSVAGAGLAGGNGTALSVGVDNSSIEINSDSLRVKALGVTNAMLGGSIANDKLANDSVTIGATEVDLGTTVTAFTGLTGLDFTAADQAIGASIGSNNLTLGGGSTTVVIDGNLTVNGSTTTVSSTNVTVGDQLLFLATGSEGSSTNKDAGIIALSGSVELQGSALYHDKDSERWSVAKSVAHNATAVTPLEHVVTVKALGDNDAAVDGDKEYGVGEMAVNSDGTIWIYS